jgi:CBS domain-containing protein
MGDQTDFGTGTAEHQDALGEAVTAFLSRHAPFDHMESDALEFLAGRLHIGFYAAGDTITGPQDGPASRYYIVKQGRVVGVSPEGEGGAENAWELTPGESFPIGALLAERPAHTAHRAAEDTFLYELDKADFDRLLHRSEAFRDFCTRRLANLLEIVQQRAQAGVTRETAGGAALERALSDVVRRPPLSVRPDATLRDALEAIRDARVSSIVVVDEAGAPLGLFTLQDLLAKVVLPGVDLDVPVREMMGAEFVSLPPRATAYEAAVSMAQSGAKHLCVVEDGRLTGVVTERDLFNVRGIGLSRLSREIAAAPDVDALARLQRELHGFVDQMLSQGVDAVHILRIISGFNDQITRRVIRLCETEGKPEIDYVWLAFGSEGRHEQTLKTDQDNGMLFLPPQGMSAEEARRQLLPLAERINEALARCGYPLCPGDVMARNPECCLSLEEWRDRFNRWIDQGTPEHLLKATIFFDFRAVAGDAAPAEELRAHLLKQSARNSRFRRQLAENALRLRPPLGLFGDFRTSKHNGVATVDLKTHGVTPFVDAARIHALGHGIGATTTLERLDAAAAQGVLQPEAVSAWRDAFRYIELLRMRLHREQAREGNALSNHMAPDQLNDLEQRILKESFRQARKLQAGLALEYQL